MKNVTLSEDAKEPGVQRVLATIDLTHAVEPGQLEKFVTLNMVGGSNVFPPNDPAPHFSITYGLHNRQAFIRSSPIVLPADEDWMRADARRRISAPRKAARKCTMPSSKKPRSLRKRPHSKSSRSTAASCATRKASRNKSSTSKPAAISARRSWPRRCTSTCCPSASRERDETSEEEESSAEDSTEESRRKTTAKEPMGRKAEARKRAKPPSDKSAGDQMGQRGRNHRRNPRAGHHR